ncbi:hypothetical protein GCM10027343_42390 [Noviherbaspirillum agri]
MQIVSQVMTRDVRFVSPQENLQRAAQLMDELNVGALPVCDGDRLVGMVTDRDITVRATAAGMAPADAHVEQVMSTDVRWCFEDQPLKEVLRQMADTQIRRVPVISHDEAHRLIGIVALGDVATKTTSTGQKLEVEQVVEKISSPSEPDRSQPVRHSRVSNAGVSARTGSDTGTASGFAGSDTIDVAGYEESDAAGAGDPGVSGERGIGDARNTATAGRRSAGASAKDTAGTMEDSGESGPPGGTDATGIGAKP